MRKPLSTKLTDADAMIAACDRAGVVFQHGFVLRFYPVHELARRMVDEGEIGDLVYVEGDLKLNGSAWILGSVVCKGKSKITFNGGATVLYSADAIQQYITKYGGKFTNLTWREL